jgi:hypothetical protein
LKTGIVTDDSIIDKEQSDEYLIGKSWWTKFLKCHPGLKTKKAVWFDLQRDDWCSVENFEAMYEEVYESMVSSGVAVKFDKEKFLDAEGNIVHSEAEAFGRKTKDLLTRPNMCSLWMRLGIILCKRMMVMLVDKSLSLVKKIEH